jgi:hypothetical protein
MIYIRRRRQSRDRYEPVQFGLPVLPNPLQPIIDALAPLANVVRIVSGLADRLTIPERIPVPTYPANRQVPAPPPIPDVPDPELGAPDIQSSTLLDETIEV